MSANNLKHSILEILVDDAQTQVDEIAVRLGVPADEVSQAIADLEREQAILKYTVLVDWEKVERGHVFAFIEVRAQPQRGEGFNQVARDIAQYDDVHSIYLMSGTHDLLVVVQGDDFRDIAQFVAEKLACRSQVTGTATSFVLKTYKRDGLLVVPEPEDERLAVTP